MVRTGKLGLRLLALVWLAAAQESRPPYDPNDPEGLVAKPNGTGRFAWKRPGHWKVSALESRGNAGRAPAATAAERQAMMATLDAMSALLRATPEGSKPIGYWMLESRGFDYPDPYEAGTAVARAPFRFASGFFPFYIEDNLINGKFVQATGGETESVYFEVNLQPGRYDRPVIASEKRANLSDLEFYPRPRVTATFAGFPVIEGKDILIARPGRDPWVAVSYGRALKAAMAQFEKDRATAEQRLDGLKKQNDETRSQAYEQKMRDQLEKNYGSLRASNPGRWQTRLASMERELVYNRELAAKRAQPQRDKDGNWFWNPIEAHEEARRRLAALPPAEADRPACFAPAADRDGRYTIQGTIVAAGTLAGCEPLVTDNRAYFDPAVPRSAAQLILVRSLGRCAKVENGRLVGLREPPRLSPPQGCQRHVPIWEAMDWSKLGALLVR
jgi:hypothetical protein